MGKYIINGGRSLNGNVKIQGAKNAILPMFAGSILTGESVFIENCPNIVDVENMSKILHLLGADIERKGEGINITCEELLHNEIPARLAKELRSSVFLLGPMLGRGRKAKVAYPGGCDIGLRPIDIHLKALSEMNVKIQEKYGYIYCDASEMRGSHVTLDYPSVGATENVMLLAVTTKGTTTISNSAREPEIVDLMHFLNSMGAKVSGAGTPFIKIEGVSDLHSTSYRAIPDRIEAGTYLTAVAVCGGEVTLEDCKMEHLNAVVSKISKSYCKITEESDNINIIVDGRPCAMDTIDTQPYPGFPTDLQAQISVVASVAKGTTVITENIFEARFKHVPELIRMGARVKVRDRTAIFNGVERLRGAEVNATDLRGGAALVVAGLNASGTTIVNDIRHIERGYDKLEEKLSALGADIVKV